MIRAAIFDAAGNPFKMMSGPARQLNANIPSGGTWREVPEDCVLPEDVPPLHVLPPHDDLVEPGA